MGTTQHSALTSTNLHICKGMDSASIEGAIIVNTGTGTQATTNTASTPVNLYDNELRRPLIKDYGIVANAKGNLGATATVDLTNGNYITGTMTANCTFTFSNPSATGNGSGFILVLTQDATGARTATWPASVKWNQGAAPTLSTGSSEIDILTFITSDAGTTWYGFVSGQAMA